jgi:hypothetical protein
LKNQRLAGLKVEYKAHTEETHGFSRPALGRLPIPHSAFENPQFAIGKLRTVVKTLPKNNQEFRSEISTGRSGPDMIS